MAPPPAARVRLCVAATAALACWSAAAEDVPAGFEDELYCPEQHCLRRRPGVPDDFAGPRMASHECAPAGDAAASSQSLQAPIPWGSSLGDEVRQDLLSRGYTTSVCAGTSGGGGAGVAPSRSRGPPVATAGSAAGAAAGAAASEEEVCAGSFRRPAVHAAFYLWYGNPEVDGRWLHWDHKVLPHWDPKIDAKHPKFNWRPPEEPHSPFMPSRGTYSSRDNATLRAQFQDLADAGVDSAMCSWWGRKDWEGKRDDANSGANTDELISSVLEAAALAGVGVSFHIEPYGGRTPETFLDDLRYIHRTYGSHPGVYRENGLPVFWMYDVSAQHSSDDVDRWRKALDSVRGTKLDGVFLCLWIGDRTQSGMEDLTFVERGGFDGAYTYFAATGFTRGSTPSSWKRSQRELRERGKLFVPAVGPGYDDSRMRPWNGHNRRERKYGEYYDRMWGAALEANAEVISVTSYNEWGEGTQIEPALPYESAAGLTYLDYLPEEPDFYLRRTRYWSDRFKAHRQESCGR